MGYTVYKLTSPSNKIYIGITSRSVEKRWANGKGYKNSIILNNAINKYGWENFKKEILFKDLEEEEAKRLEVSLIKSHNAKDRRYGYNMTDGGEGTKGRFVSEEVREKYRQINLGKKLTEEHKKRISERKTGAKNPRARKVICLETLKVYDTMTEAQKETGATKITVCCKHYNKHKSSNGLHWEYYDEKLSDSDYKDILKRLLEEEYQNKHKAPSEELKRKNAERTSVAVVCVESGEIFKSIREACNKYGIDPPNLCNCCKGKKKTAKGLHWRYAL